VIDALVHGIHWLIEALLRPLDGLVPWVSLAIIAMPTAVLILVVVRRTSPQKLIARSRSQMAASIFEMRLYLDHPLQLLRAQARLVGWSVLYVACLIPSLVVMAAPLALLSVHLEIRHGLAPLAAPQSTVVRIEVANGISVRDVAIDVDDSLAVTARVHVDDERALYARIAITQPGSHRFIVHAGETRTEATLEADPDSAVVSAERRAGLSQLWAFGAEPPLDGAVRSISIPYPERSSAVPWWLYWLGAATVFALLLRRRFGVAL
jgi:hypothetical protein